MMMPLPGITVVSDDTALTTTAAGNSSVMVNAMLSMLFDGHICCVAMIEMVGAMSNSKAASLCCG